MTHYAQASKGFVEVVLANRKPVVEVSFLKRSYYDWWLNRSMERKIPVVAFKGGKVRWSFSPRKFGDLTGHTLRPGTVWRLSAEHVAKIERYKLGKSVS